MNLVTMEPVWRPANQQKIYRRLLDAFSYPGRVIDLSDLIGDSRAELAILACLVDEQVSYSDPDARIEARERALLRADCVAPELADFVLHAASNAPQADYTPRLGDLYRPDSAATLILSGDRVGNDVKQYVLRGPGIEWHEELCLSGFDEAWLTRRAEWVSNFPQGVDIFLCAGQQVVGLPRTTQIDSHTLTYKHC